MVPPTLEKIQEMQRDWIAEDLAIWELTQIYAARELCNRGVPLDPANPEYLHALRTPRDLGTGTGDGPACGAAVLRCALSGNDPEVTKRDGARAREWLDQHPTIIPAMIIAGLPLPDEPAEAPRVTQRMLKWLAENERLTALQTLKQDLDHNPAFIQAVSEELLTAPRATKPIENP